MNIIDNMNELNPRKKMLDKTASSSNVASWDRTKKRR